MDIRLSRVALPGSFDVSAALDNLQQYRTNQIQNQLAKLTYDAVAQKLADQNTMRQIAKDSVQREEFTDYPTMDGEKLPGLYTGNKTFDMPGYKNRLYAAGLVDQAMGVEKTQADAQKAQWEAAKQLSEIHKNMAQTGLYGVQTQEQQAKAQAALRLGRLTATRDALKLVQTGNVGAGLAHYNASVPEGERITGYRPMGNGLALTFENGTQMQIPDVGQVLSKLEEALTPSATIYTENRKAPEIQDVYQGGRVVQRQWNPATQSFSVVGGGPRWNPNPSTVINNNMQGEKAFAVETAKQDAQYLADLRAQAAAAREIAQRVSEASRLADAGVFTGSWANRRADAVNFLNSLGFPVLPDKLANSQAFNAHIGELVLARVKQLGSNPSNTDREFVERTVPNLTQSPKARQALLNYLQEQAQRTIDTYQSADKYGRAHNGLGGWQPPSAPDGMRLVVVNGRKVPVKLAPDGHYYVKQNGKYYRVE